MSTVHHRATKVHAHHLHHLKAGKLDHRPRLFSAFGRHFDNVTRSVGHAAQHTLTFFHHHAAASIGVVALSAIVISAAIMRGLLRAQMLRLARWMGAPRTGPPPPGTIP